MRILLVNKFHWLKGGSETYYFELGKMLKAHGHEVAYFSMYDEKNIKTGDREYFVEPSDMNSKNIFKAFNVIYNRKNKKIMDKALEEFKPDVVHVNLFQRQLTYSIIKACKEKNIPVVFTAHDLQAVCPASAMLCNGKICSACLNKSKFNCVKKRCVKNSFLKSLLCSIEATIYKKSKVYNSFNLIISPSSFVGNMMKNDGVTTKIVTLHNFIDIDFFCNLNGNDNEYAFFFGRLSKEKGIVTLLKAFSKQPYGNLVIAGDGPEKESIIRYINDNNLTNRVKLLGHVSRDEVKTYISNCSFVVLPSIWYENCSYSIIETLSTGKPVIASRIGGNPELIDDGINGFLYRFDDIGELSSIMSKMFKNSELRKKMGENARKYAVERYSMDLYYNKIIDCYSDVVKGG